MYLLSDKITQELAHELYDMVKCGISFEYAEDHICQLVLNNYDGEIWELVDSEENTDSLDYYDYANEIVNEISVLAKNYLRDE